MNTWTINRTVADNLFVALNDSCYADYQESQSFDWNDRRVEKSSLLDRILNFIR